MMQNKKAFTLVELLVVISIIGLLATVAVVALGSARVKSRDGKRVADVRNIGAAMEQFFSDEAGYTDLNAGAAIGSGGVTLGAGTGLSLCSGVADGLKAACAAADTTYMGKIPPDPGTNSYLYRTWTASDAATDCTTGTVCPWYTITFTLETAVGGLAAGAHTQSPNGMQ